MVSMVTCAYDPFQRPYESSSCNNFHNRLCSESFSKEIMSCLRQDEIKLSYAGIVFGSCVTLAKKNAMVHPLEHKGSK